MIRGKAKTLGKINYMNKPQTKYIEWGKSRFTVVSMENDTVINK